MKAPSDQIWAYLHDELEPEKRARFEEALQSDPDLYETLEACRSTHQELTDILPLLSEAENPVDLEERLLTEWEAEHTEYAEVSAQKPGRKIIPFSLPLAAAAAAAAFLLLTVPSQQQPIDWLKTNYGTAPQLRGETDATATYSRTELKKASRELQESVETNLSKRSDTADSWTLKIDLQELANGALAVELSGHQNSAKHLSMIWSGNFNSLENFRESIPLLGSQVVETLAERNNP